MTVPQADDLRDEALRKIGRNIVNLQKMERALKLLIVLSDLKGSMSELKGVYEKRLADVEKLTMGHLANKAVDILYSAADTNAEAPAAAEGRVDRHNRIDSLGQAQFVASLIGVNA